MGSDAFAGPYAARVYEAYADARSYFHRFIDPRKTFRDSPFASGNPALLREPNGTIVRNPDYVPRQGADPAWVRPRVCPPHGPRGGHHVFPKYEPLKISKNPP